MAKDPKTIFAVEIDGVSRSLLAINENKRGHLILTMGHSNAADTLEGQREDIHNRHMSVHPATVGKSITLTDKWEFRSGKKESIVSHIQPYEGRLFWLAFTKRLHALGKDTGAFTARNKDRIINIGRFNQDRATLLFAVMIADKSFRPEEFDIPSAKVFCARFKKYWIGLICNYLNAPATPEGKRLMVATSGPMKGSTPSPIRTKQQSMTPQTLSLQYRASMEGLRVDFISEAARLLTEAKKQDDSIEVKLSGTEKWLQTFTPDPILPVD